MIWKDIMLTSYEQPLFNWKQTLSGIDVEKFKRQYLDPASGYVGVVRCPDREKCSPHECCGLNIRDLSSGTTACCSQRFSGPRIPVSQEDVTRYGLSHPRFHAELCRKTLPGGIAGKCLTVDDKRRRFSIHFLYPQGSTQPPLLEGSFGVRFHHHRAGVCLTRQCLDRRHTKHSI